MIHLTQEQTDGRSVNRKEGEPMALKDRIVEAAYELFGEKGYDRTSVAEIIEKAGASKGGFYHHFKSKEEILETITFENIRLVRNSYEALLKDEQMAVTDKFIAAYTEVNDMKIASVKDWDRIRNLYAFEDNHRLLLKMSMAFEKETVTFYKALIQEGIRKGVFSVSYPEPLAALWGREVIKFQQMSRKVLTGEEVTEEAFLETLRFNESLINQQLGLEAKTIDLESMGRSYLSAMADEMKGKVL